MSAAGTINLSHTVYVNANYLIIRGTGPDPDNGGTQIVFTPDENSKYDVLTADGSQVSLPYHIVYEVQCLIHLN